MTREPSTPSLRSRKHHIPVERPSAIPFVDLRALHASPPSAGLVLYCAQKDEDVDEDVASYLRFTRKCAQTDEEKAHGSAAQFSTCWFESEGNTRLTAPPDAMVNRHDLEIGDLFCHYVPHLDDPQIWMWCEIDKQRHYWKAVTPGCIRSEDKRRLMLNPSQKPSWVGEAWYRKKGKQPDDSSRKGKGRR
ncbi:hypothetical protein BV20DRAFT_977509 [Pilatotrama ljubarskyi]|nr:hypothetical protein BV20DRAFT_977509 [Pilatotrama ljubarskyi]